MTRRQDKAVEERLKKATNTWKHVSRKIFRNKAFGRMIQIMIWNSLIRSTMIYGLHTRDLSKHMMANGNLHVQTNNDDGQHGLGDRRIVPGKSNSTRNYNKQRWNHGSIKHKLWQCWHRRKTTKWYTQGIAKRCSCQESNRNNSGGRRNHAILEQMNPRKQETKEQRHHPPAKKTTQTELTQHIEAHPEMPEETELNRDDRKQLAELMIEYPRSKTVKNLPRKTKYRPRKKKDIYTTQLQPISQINDRKVQPH